MLKSSVPARIKAAAVPAGVLPVCAPEGPRCPDSITVFPAIGCTKPRLRQSSPWKAKIVIWAPYGSPESRRAYDQLCCDFIARRGVPISPPRVSEPPLLVSHLLVAFLRHARHYYRHPNGRPTGEARAAQNAAGAGRPTGNQLHTLTGGVFHHRRLPAGDRPRLQAGLSAASASAATERRNRSTVALPAQRCGDARLERMEKGASLASAPAAAFSGEWLEEFLRCEAALTLLEDRSTRMIDVYTERYADTAMKLAEQHG